MLLTDLENALNFEHLNEVEYKWSGSAVLESTQHAAVREKTVGTLPMNRFTIKLAVSLHTVCACLLARRRVVC